MCQDLEQTQQVFADQGARCSLTRRGAELAWWACDSRSGGSVSLGKPSSLMDGASCVDVVVAVPTS